MIEDGILNIIAETTKKQEDAIQNKSPQIANLYIAHRDAFIEGQLEAKETAWSKSKSLTLDELTVMHRYMLSSSFLSAWFDLKGNKKNRDKTANSCSLLLAGNMDVDPELVLQRFIKYEELWQKTLKHEGIAPTSKQKIGFILSIIIIGIALIFFYLPCSLSKYFMQKMLRRVIFNN